MLIISEVKKPVIPPFDIESIKTVNGKRIEEGRQILNLFSFFEVINGEETDMLKQSAEDEAVRADFELIKKLSAKRGKCIVRYIADCKNGKLFIELQTQTKVMYVKSHIMLILMGIGWSTTSWLRSVAGQKHLTYSLIALNELIEKDLENVTLDLDGMNILYSPYMNEKLWVENEIVAETFEEDYKKHGFDELFGDRFKSRKEKAPDLCAIQKSYRTLTDYADKNASSKELFNNGHGRLYLTLMDINNAQRKIGWRFGTVKLTSTTIREQKDYYGFDLDYLDEQLFDKPFASETEMQKIYIRLLKKYFAMKFVEAV